MGSRFPIRITHLRENDIPVYSWRNALVNTGAVAFRVGSADDPPRLDGAAHLMEHMVCRKSNTYTEEEAELIMERLFGGTDGPGISVYTMQTHTVYGHEDLPTPREAREGFLLMASFARDAVIECHNMHPGDQRLYDMHSLLVERAAVRNETALRRGDSALHIDTLIPQAMYRVNPVRREGMGDTAHLRKLQKIGRLKQWAAGHYCPAKMMVVLLGPTQGKALELVAEAGLDTLKNYKATENPYDHSEDMPHLEGIREVILDCPGIQQTHVGLAWPTETFSTKDGPALEVLARILKWRIEQVLREENTDIDAGVYHPSADWSATKYHGVLDVWYATLGGASYVGLAEGKVLRICEELKVDTTATFRERCEAIRTNMVGQIFQEWKWFPGVIRDRIIEHASNGDPELKLLRSYRRRMECVTPAAVRRVAGKYLTTDRFIRVIKRPLFVPQDVYDRATEESKPYLRYLLKPTD